MTDVVCTGPTAGSDLSVGPKFGAGLPACDDPIARELISLRFIHSVHHAEPLLARAFCLHDADRALGAFWRLAPPISNALPLGAGAPE
ncbi:MAG: hypothetical protein AAF913_09105 [Pseudomonadota bacterium]